MARYFQFYVKKRGARRTDSPMIGRLALTLFFAALLLVGVGFIAALLIRLIIPEWRAKHHFVATTATVLKTRARPVSADNANRVRPEVQIQYEVDGASYTTWTYDVARVEAGAADAVQAMLDRFQPGQDYPCWYDPEDHERAVVVRRYSWAAWSMLLLPLSLVIAGGGGLAITLLNWGKSAERRAALAQRTLNLELFEPAVAGTRQFPTLPVDHHLTNSPGTTLKYRLPMDVAPKWTSLVLVLVAAALLTAAAIFTVLAAPGLGRGEIDWFMTIFSAVWWLAGGLVLALLLRGLVRDAAVGATIVEVSDHPWRPGEHYELFLNQGGRADLSRLDVRLVCEEKATYSQGTNTRTERVRTFDESLLQREDLEIGKAQPFEARCEVTLPTRAMHSFVADHNEIAWRLVVQGAGRKQRAFERSFPIIVYPPREHGAAL